MKAAIRAAVEAASSLTGKRFGLLVASSVVATSAIVASAMTGAGSSGALAALLGRSLASDNTPVATAPAAGPSSLAAQPSRSQGGAASHAGGPLASPAPAPAPGASGPVSEQAPKEPAATPAEAGPVKHVFVISLSSPGYEQSLGAQSQMPYLSATLRPKGELLSNYTLLGEAGLPNQIAALNGQPPNAATSAGCSSYAEFSSTAKTDSRGIVHGAGCVYPVEILTLADQLTSGRLTWRAYVDGMVDETGAPANCVHPGSEEAETVAPGGYAARQNPFVYFHSLLDLGDCAADDLPIDRLTADLRKADKTPNYSFIAPTPCDCGRDRPVLAWRNRRPGKRRRLPRELGPEDPRLAGLQGRRPADRQLRLGEPPGHGTGSDAASRSTARRRPPHLAISDSRLHRRRALQPLLAAPLHRGPLRTQPPRPGRRSQDEVLRPEAAQRERRRLTGESRSALRRRPNLDHAFALVAEES